MNNIYSFILTMFLFIAIYLFFKDLKKNKYYPSIIIYNGKLNFKEMIRRKYKLSDLLTIFKNNKIKNIENIDFAVLDNKGNLSLFYKYDYDNMKKPILLVLNGEIEYHSLKEIGKNIKWLNLVLEEKKLKLDEIFYAFYLENSFYVIKKVGL